MLSVIWLFLMVVWVMLLLLAVVGYVFGVCSELYFTHTWKFNPRKWTWLYYEP